MIAPFKFFPLPVKVALMFSMFVLNSGIGSYIGYISVHSLFGVQAPEKVAEGIMINNADVNGFLFMQACAAIFGFVLTPLLFAHLESGNAIKQLRLRIGFRWQLLIPAVIALLSAQFFIEWLVRLNQQIPLPESLQFLLEAQEKTERLTKSLLSFSSVSKLFFVSFVIAVIPGIGEELFFRAMLLGNFLKAKRNVWLSVLLTGLLFSLIHFTFKNVLAIWVLGSFLGFLYYVSGSVWLPVIIHFLNNFMQVFFSFLHHRGYISQDFMDASAPWWLALSGAFVFIGCSWYLYQHKENIEFDETSDKDHDSEINETTA